MSLCKRLLIDTIFESASSVSANLRLHFCQVLSCSWRLTLIRSNPRPFLYLSFSLFFSFCRPALHSPRLSPAMVRRFLRAFRPKVHTLFKRELRDLGMGSQWVFKFAVLSLSSLPALHNRLLTVRESVLLHQFHHAFDTPQRFSLTPCACSQRRTPRPRCAFTFALLSLHQ